MYKQVALQGEALAGRADLNRPESLLRLAATRFARVWHGIGNAALFCAAAGPIRAAFLSVMLATAVADPAAALATHRTEASSPEARTGSADVGRAYTLKVLNDTAEACGADPAVLQVDISKPMHPRNLVGFLLSQQSPPALVAPLRPAAWRANPEDYRSLSRYNPNLILQCSPFASFTAANGRAPRSLAEFRDFTGAWLNRYSAIASHLVVEMQNEPDLGAGPIEAQEATAFANYLEAFRAAKHAGSDVKFTGPNTSVPDMRWIVDFAEFCLSQSCEIDYLSWHFAKPSETRAIVKRVTDTVIANPRYRSLKIKGIIISEFTVEDEATEPATNLSHFSAMESAGVYAAMKACWSDNCYGQTLDGLLSKHLQPLPVWHLWKFYADSLLGRVYSATSDPSVPIIASRTGDGRSWQLLVANDALGSATKALDLRLLNLPLQGQENGRQLEVVLEDMSREDGPTPRLRMLVDARPTIRLCLEFLPAHVAARLRLVMPSRP